jgi:hypothetical protein
MIDLLFILGAGALSIGIVKWCEMGLNLYFDHIADIDQRQDNRKDD